jgi:hypothetical protein
VALALAALKGPKRWQDEAGWWWWKDVGMRNFEPEHHFGNSTQSRGVGVLTNLENYVSIFFFLTKLVGCNRVLVGRRKE